MKSNSRAFVNQFLLCLLVTTCFGGSIGVGIVWMRHRISITANANRALSARIAEVERYVAENRALVESVQRPDELRRLNADLRLGLEPVGDGQMLPVTEDPVRRLATRVNRGMTGDAPVQVLPIIALRH